MLKKAVLGMMLCGLALGLSPSFAWAETPVSGDKLKAYAQLYPEMFLQSTHNVSYRPAKGKPQAVALLLESFNGDTKVDELSAALGHPVEKPATAMKPDAQIKQILASKNLQWNEYLEITRNLANDSQQFQLFLEQLDKQHVTHHLVNRAMSDPGFIRDIQSREHQMILRNLMASFKK